MINRYASLRQGLVGCWVPSLGASGYRLIDRSGNNNHGTLTNMDPGTDWVPSGGKLALDFDGSNDYAIVRNLPKRNNVDPISLGGWFYATAGSYGYSNYFLSIPYVSSGTNGIDFTNPQAVRFNLFGAGSNVSIDTSIDLRNKWTHVFGVFDGLQGMLYANGSLVGTASQTFGTNTESRELNIGRFGGFGGYASIHGDDVRIYNRVLNPNEIRLLYTGGRGVGLMPERIKHRRKTSAAATNRRRRILIGASQ